MFSLLIWRKVIHMKQENLLTITYSFLYCSYSEQPRYEKTGRASITF